MARTLPTPVENVSPVVRSLHDLGQLVRNQRARSRLRIDDAAALSQVSSDVLSRLENGKPITVDKLMRVLDNLGLRMVVVPVRQLTGLELAITGSASAASPHEVPGNRQSVDPPHG